MKYRRRKKHNKNQKKILIISTVSLIFVMTVGYAAFSTNLNINAKGNIIKQTAAQKLRKICDTKDGDGLYIDVYEENRCVYRGSNPNNYIEFNDELWRIIAVEPDDTLKIIINDTLGIMPYDGSKSNNRYNENNSYCTIETQGMNYSCNVWGAVSGIFDSGIYKGTVSEDADLNIYLNNDYYNSLTIEAQNQIQTHDFKMGSLFQNVTFENYLNQDNKYIWHGNIGLINLSDWFKASNNSNCITASNDWCPPDNYKQEDYECSFNNYLYNNKQYWTMNPNNISTKYVLAIGSHGCVGNGSSAHTTGVSVRPVLFLKANISLEGEGTESNPYKISSE